MYGLKFTFTATSQRDFRTYIQRYTSPNDNFEYAYLHSNALVRFIIQKKNEKFDVASTYCCCHCIKILKDVLENIYILCQHILFIKIYDTV